MAKKYGTRRRTRRSSKKYGGRRGYRRMRGGMAPWNPADISGMSQGGAGGYEISQIGSSGDSMVTDGQLNKVVDLLSGPKYAEIPNVNSSGNADSSFAPGTAGQPEQAGQPGQAGGRRGRKSRRGGFLGQVIGQAAVPFALLGAQQYYGSRRRRGTRRR